MHPRSRHPAAEGRPGPGRGFHEGRRGRGEADFNPAGQAEGASFDAAGRAGRRFGRGGPEDGSAQGPGLRRGGRGGGQGFAMPDGEAAPGERGEGQGRGRRFGGRGPEGLFEGDRPQRHGMRHGGRDGGDRGEGRGHGGRRGGGRHGDGEGRQRIPRMLAHGDLRLLLVALLEAQPRHGYELIQLIGEIFRGQYMPSAGAVYPALAQLQEDGLVSSSEDGTRRLHALTEAGQAFARDNAELLALARERTERSAKALVKAGLPAPVRGGMSAIKRALLPHHASWTAESGEQVAEILTRAAAEIAKVPHG